MSGAGEPRPDAVDPDAIPQDEIAEDDEPRVPDHDPNEELERPKHLCKHLRMRNEQIPDLSNDLYLDYHHPYMQYYCSKTIEAVGPDDESVCPEDCTPDRDCFERSIHSPRT